MDALPPGQRPRADQPPYGLPWFAHRMPAGVLPSQVLVGGVVGVPVVLTDDVLGLLERQEQTTDLHCVTTWTRVGARWGGVRFADVYRQLVAPHLDGVAPVTHLRFTGADGYHDTLPLSDLLHPDVLLADMLDGAPLPRGNGAPLRLVAPAHYGYKNVKYLTRIDVLAGTRPVRLSLHHPRARVAHEERFLGLPYRAVRVVYRLLVPLNVRWFRFMMRTAASAPRSRGSRRYR